MACPSEAVGSCFCWGRRPPHRKKGGGYKALEDFAAQVYPESEIKYRWAAQDCMSLDGIPYIGRYSATTPNLYVATGFQKWGMTSSMVAAMLLRDMAQGRHSDWEAVFSPSRSIIKPQLFVNVLDSAAGLLTPSFKRCPHMGCALEVELAGAYLGLPLSWVAI